MKKCLLRNKVEKTELETPYRGQRKIIRENSTILNIASRTEVIGKCCCENFIGSSENFTVCIKNNSSKNIKRSEMGRKTKGEEEKKV